MPALQCFNELETCADISSDAIFFVYVEREKKTILYFFGLRDFTIFCKGHGLMSIKD